MKIKEEFEVPFSINQALIDFKKYDESIIFTLRNIINANVFNIQIRFFGNISIDEMKIVINELEFLGFRSVSMVLEYINAIKYELISDLILQNYFFQSIIVYNSPVELSIENKNCTKIVYTKQKILNEKSCGCISLEYFNINDRHFYESLKHNTCLNKKISVDTEGNVKNCPSMMVNYGKIGSKKLNNIIDEPEFKKYWNIKKDDVKICRDCEFRHICTDCRAYLEVPNDIYSKPLKCGYNPYIGKWSEWSSNPLKQKAIEYYNLNEDKG